MPANVHFFTGREKDLLNAAMAIGSAADIDAWWSVLHGIAVEGEMFKYPAHDYVGYTLYLDDQDVALPVTHAVYSFYLVVIALARVQKTVITRLIN